MDVAAGGPLGAMEARATAALRDLEPGRRAAEDARRTAAWRGQLESTAIDTTTTRTTTTDIELMADRAHGGGWKLVTRH